MRYGVVARSRSAARIHPVLPVGRDGSRTCTQPPCSAITGNHTSPNCVGSTRAIGVPSGASCTGVSRSGCATVPSAPPPPGSAGAPSTVA